MGRESLTIYGATGYDFRVQGWAGCENTKIRACAGRCRCGHPAQNWGRVIEQHTAKFGREKTSLSGRKSVISGVSTPAANVAPFGLSWATLARPRGHAQFRWVLRASFTRPANP